MQPASELYVLWLRASGYKPKTISTYTESLVALERFSGSGAEVVSRAELLSWLHHLHTTTSAATASIRIRSAKRFFSWCVSEGIRSDDPSKGLSVRVPQQVYDTPSLADLAERLRARPRTATQARDIAIVGLLAYAGLRKAECAALSRADIDVRSQLVTVRSSKSEPRVVPITAQVAVMVSRWLRHHSGTHSNVWDVGRPYDLVRRSVRRFTGGQYSPHDFRRMFAVEFLASGGSTASLMALAGWNDVTMPVRYTRGAAQALATIEYRRLFG